MLRLEAVASGIWNPWLLGGFLLVGLYVSLRSGFFQIFECRLWLSRTGGSLFRKKKAKGQGITQFQAVSTALASTIGTGSIAGVATAIFYGGPGAVFWMWISALLGMMLGCVEKILAVQYRKPDGTGGWMGGPMYYIRDGLRCPMLAKGFALFCILAALAGGNLAQANSIASVLEFSFGWSPLAVGAVTVFLTGLVIWGGIERIARVSEAVVPVMALAFLSGGLWVIGAHANALPQALYDIVTQALLPKAALGGAGGYGISVAMRYGVARGVFSNEAGVGSSAIAHAAAQTDQPAEEGLWGIFEVFVATLVVCTVSALAILVSGVYNSQAALQAIVQGRVSGAMSGAPLSAAAFSTVMGAWGGRFVAVCLLLFAFSSLLGWSYYGERGVAYLTSSQRWIPLFRMVFLLCILVGSLGDVGVVWEVTDICNGLMALPNLIAIALMTPQALNVLWVWREMRKT